MEMRIHRKIRKQMMAACLVLGAWLTLVPGMTAEAAEKKIVRMGYYENDNFQSGAGDDLVKSGYSYEYMRRLQKYTDWEYEYVYGEYGDLYNQLVAGEIDLLTGLAYKPEREEILSYPQEPMGGTPYAFLKRSEEVEITEDPQTIAGRKIGVLEGAMEGITANYLKEHDIEAEIVVFGDIQKRNEALVDKSVDIIITEGNGTDVIDGVEAFAEAGESDFYVVVNKARPDIREDLDEAQTELFRVNPQIREELNEKWFRLTIVSSALTAEEKAWVDSHDTLNVGYYSDYLPYSAKDTDGSVTGVVKDVTPEILKALSIKHIETNYKSYDDYDEMVQAIQTGEIDIMFPVYVNYWATEQADLMPTDPIISTYYNLVYKGNYPDKEKLRIAVPASNAVATSFARVQFRDSEILPCASREECMDKVISGDADATLINGLGTDYYLNRHAKYKSLHSAQVTGEMSLGFASLNSNTEVVDLFNHGIGLMERDYALIQSYQYQLHHKTTIQEFLMDNAPLASGVVALFALLVVMMIARELKKNKTILAMEQKQSAELAEAKDQAEKASRAKTSFLFNMSHDIRTPMNAIMGFRDLLEKNQEDPEKRGYYLHQIEESSTILLSIINNVLEMARIEKGTIEVDEIAWSAEQFNDTLYSVFQGLMADKGLIFTRNVDVQHHYVLCDPTKLREVFLNILSNAYKYTQEGGKVHMDLTEIPCDREGYALYRTTITDTGIGMSAEFLPHIFEEFAREQTSTVSKIEGTGLGMPIVKRLVEFMDGTIEVSSEQGKGSTFTVTLPHKITDRSSLTNYDGVEIDPNLFKGKRILLAEDIAVNAEIACAILGEAGFVVERAENGKECVEMLTAAEPLYYDLVLMDIQMPVMNGYEATRAIRKLEDSKKASIPIVAMTANAFEEDKREAYRAGMNGHVAKPINVKQLMHTLAQVL